jgi:hypothetical protein
MAEFKAGDRVVMCPPNGATFRDHDDWSGYWAAALSNVLTVRSVFRKGGAECLSFFECAPTLGMTGEGPDSYWRFNMVQDGHVWFRHHAISSKEDIEKLYD